VRRSKAGLGQLYELWERPELASALLCDANVVVGDIGWRVGLGDRVVEGMNVTPRAKGGLHALLIAKVVVAANAHDDTRLRAVGIELLDAMRIAHPLPAVARQT